MCDKLVVYHHDKMESLTIYENNSACISQLKEGYIKGDKTKYILSKN